uniref:CSON013923 protein n=1 Tax=Culicoides sonorensis TaxID=179676 RepID=A0A336KPQ4_CULSO
MIGPTKTNFGRIWQKLWKFILGMKIELAFLLYFAPGTLNTIGLELLPIEKACRINLNYSDIVCSNLNNAYLKELCPSVYEFEGNESYTSSDFILNFSQENNLTDSDSDILFDVCTAETEAQALKLQVQTDRAPLGYLALIVIIFAGPLGDKYNRKKPFLLLPMIGELISVTAYLITSIFQTTVPMQFHLYLETFVNSICGGFSLMLMGVFSILAATTAEEDRTFRFGVFSAFSSGAGIVLSPLAKYVFEWMGYVYMFIFCLIIHICGVIFIIFYIDEVPKPTESANHEMKKEKTEPISTLEGGKVNPGYDATTESTASTLELRSRSAIEEKVISQLQEAASTSKAVSEEVHKNIVRESFDMFISNFKVLSVVRPFSGRVTLCLIIIGYSIFVFSNTDVLLLSSFGRIAWGWTTEFALYASFNTAVGFIGTLIVTGIFVNLFKLADPLLVIIAVICRLISRLMYAFTKDFAMIYLAGGIDMFNSAPAVAIRSVLSKIVAVDELGRLYTVMSVLETLISPLSVKAYVKIFQDYLETKPGTFYFLTVGLLAVVILLFIRIHSMVKPFLIEAANEEAAGEQKENADQNDNIESSRL